MSGWVGVGVPTIGVVMRARVPTRWAGVGSSHRPGLERSDLGRRALKPGLSVHGDRDRKVGRVADLIQRDQVGAELGAVAHVFGPAEAAGELQGLDREPRRR